MRISRHCSYHSGEHAVGGSPGPLVISAPRLGSNPAGVDVSDLEAAAVAVHLQAPTVIGEDPYQSVVGVGAPAEPVAEDPGKRPREDAMPPLPLPTFDPASDNLTPLPGKAAPLED